ncbi:MAG: hypothetical protein AABZ53_17375 [Planctomycetota bacterium]
MNTNRAIRGFLFVALAALGVACVPGCASGGSSASTLDPKAKYAFWPQAPDEPRVQFLGSFNSSEDVQETKSSGLEKLVFGAEAVRPAFVNKPYGVAIRDGKIYVCDIRAKALVVMDLGKKQTRLVGTTGTNRLERPVAVAVGDDGQIYVADGIHGAVFVFDTSERFARSIVIPKLKPASIAFMWPTWAASRSWCLIAPAGGSSARSEAWATRTGSSAFPSESPPTRPATCTSRT